MEAWYRQQLIQKLQLLIPKWQKTMNIEIADWRIKKMKTKWGSCNTQTRRIWFNLELAKKPERCLEYILVHEMVHLLERNHNYRFRSLMNKFMPRWRSYREELKSAVLGDTRWVY
jgi:predicted metal-dependent hydrolase